MSNDSIIKFRPLDKVENVFNLFRHCRKNRSTCSIRQCCFDIVAGVDGALRNKQVGVYRVTAALNACRSTRCPRYKVCLLNIQGLPMCRCPSVYHCRGFERRPVCTVDGRSYRNECFLRVDECAANRRLRVRHRGPCRAGPGRRSFDTGASTTRRHRVRQRQQESSVDEVHVRRRPRRRRPRHKPVTGTGQRHHPRTSRHWPTNSRHTIAVSRLVTLHCISVSSLS